MGKKQFDIRAPIVLVLLVLVIGAFILGSLEVISRNRAASNKTELFSIDKGTTIEQTTLTNDSIDSLKQYINEFKQEMSDK